MNGLSVKRSFSALSETDLSDHRPPKLARSQPGATDTAEQRKWWRPSWHTLTNWLSPSTPTQPSMPVHNRVQPRNSLLPSHPNGSLAWVEDRAGRAGRAGNGREVVEISDDDEESGLDVLATRQQRARGTQEARQHLNDHVVRPGSIHPNLTRPLFDSTFSPDLQSSLVVNTRNARLESSSPGAGPSSAPSTPATASNRPDVDFKKPDRVYAWKQQDGASRQTTPDAFAPRQGRRSPKSSARPGRNVSGHDGQNRMLQRHKEQAILSGDPHVAKSFSRVQAAYQQDLTKTSRHATRPFATHVGLPPADLSAALGSLNLDNRKPLDETLQGRPVSKSIPKVVKRDQRPAAPPLDVVKGHVYTQLREQDREAERQVRERLQPRIPKDVTDDQAAIIEKRLRDHAFEAILGTATLSASSLQRLRPNTWLNDEVMNFYAEMINTRAKLDKRPLHCMNTFFFEKLSSVGYTEAKLARWTKRLKLDIFALDKLLIPINHDNSHWVCAVINFKQRRIEYYDSLTDPDRRYKVFKTLRGYLESEHKEKKGSPFDLSNWRDQFDPNTPKQNNFTDCGVFACQTLESTARGRDLIKEKFEFNGNDMAFFRRLMLVEIASGELGKRPWGT